MSRTNWRLERRLHSLRSMLDARYTPRLACRADIQDVHRRKLVPAVARAKERLYRLEYTLHRAVRARDTTRVRLPRMTYTLGTWVHIHSRKVGTNFRALQPPHVLCSVVDDPDTC